MAREFAFGAAACETLGSPLYGRLMERAAADARAGGIIAEMLAPWADEPRGAAIGLRLFGTVHRLALTGDAPGLARWYPSCGANGDVDVDAAWQEFIVACEEHRGEIEEGLHQPPQTNEVGRGAALRAGLEVVARTAELPLRLFELGASGGLNLRCDRFRVDTPVGYRGPTDSPVRIRDAWNGAVPQVETPLQVRSRTGCDISPVDPSSDEQALRLQSYVWPDQVDRFERLRGAIRLARSVPAQVVEESAPSFLARVQPVEGSVTVVQHSVMWQYLSDDDRRDAQLELDRLREAATEQAPVARVAFEPARTEDDSDVDYGDLRFAVTAACWPHLDERVMARAHPHGPPVVWL